MKRILLVVGLLFASTTMDAYTVGALDSITGTDNGGTGYGTLLQSSAPGYVVQSITGSTAVDLVNASAIQPDGKTVVVGSAGTSMAIARFNINGTLDTTFNSPTGYVTVATGTIGTGAAAATGVAIQNDGKIVVYGSCTLVSGASYFIARYTAAGIIDGTGASSSIFTAAGYITQNIGVILSAGTAGPVVTTSVDTPSGIVINSSGNILVTGTSVVTQAGHGITQDIYVARYTSAGALDTTFNSGKLVGGANGAGVLTAQGIALLSIAIQATTTLTGNGIALDANGNILVVGALGVSATNMVVARFLSTGVSDTTVNGGSGFNQSGTPGYLSFNVSGTGVARAVGVQSASATSPNRIIVVGNNTVSAVVAGITGAGALDTANFGAGGTGYNSSLFSQTSAIAYGVAIQSDDKVVIGGQTLSVSDFLIARYLADGSALDTGFNPSAGFTTNQLGAVASLGKALSLQQNGSFIVAGTAGATTSFGVARYLGTQSVQGAMDYSYNAASGATSTSPVNQGFSVYPTDTALGDLPEVVAMYPLSGSLAGRLYVLTSESGSTNTQLAQLASTGAAAATKIVIAKSAPADVIADSKNRAVVVGTDSSNGWIAQYYVTGGALALDPSFNSGAIKVETNSSSFRRVAEQSEGRLIVMGQGATSTSGLLIAYNENGALADHNQTVCAPFGTNPGSGVQGFITLATSTFYDVLVDPSDNIYVAYSDGTNLKVAKYLANGSGLSTGDFGTGGIVTVGAVSTYTGIPSIAFDPTFAHITLAVTDSSGNISLSKIVNATGTSIASGSIAQTASLLSTPVITKLQCDTNNRLIFNGYDTNDFFVGRCGAGVLTLDTVANGSSTPFAPYSNCPGIMKTMYSTNNPTNAAGVSSARVSNSVCINASSGNILFGGYENITSSTTVSLVGQVVANSGGTVYPQVNRFPGALVSGTINTAYGTSGAFDLNSISSTSFPLGQARAINVITTGAQAGKMLVADSNGTDTTITILNATGTAVDSGAFGGGVSGKVTLTGMTQAQAIIVDPTGLVFYIVGLDAKVRSVTYGSATVTTFATSTLVSGYTSAIAQQASGRILVSGYDVTNNGVIVAYTPAGAIDTSFNPGGAGSAPAGYWYGASFAPIIAISVGTQAAVKDKIYYAYSDGSGALGNGLVQRLLENGTALDSSFTPITNAFAGTVNTNTQLRMRLDVNGAIVLAAATAASPSAIQAARYNGDGSTGGTYGVAAFTVVAALTNQTIQRLLTLSDGSTLILAMAPSGTPLSSTMTVARLTPVFALDTVNFNPLGTPGYLTTTVPSGGTGAMADYYAFDVVSTGGILISGDNGTTAGSAHPYLAEIVQTNIVTKVSQSATALGAAGTLDTTFNPAGTDAGFMNYATADLAGSTSGTRFPAGTIAKVLLQNSNGSYFVAGDNGTNTYVTQMTDDDVQMSGWASGRLTVSPAAANVSGMLIGQNGNLYITGGVGTSGTHLGWLHKYLVSDGSQITGFAPTSFLDANYAIAQQSTGRILVAGIAAGVGTIIAYNSTTGAVDTTFATNGIFTATGYTAINSMIVDASDNIYFMANTTSSPTATVVAIDPNGTLPIVAPLWATPITVNSAIAANNHLAFNQAGNIVAVAVETSGTVQIAMKALAPGATGGNLVGTALLLPNSGGTPTGIVTPNVTSIMVDMNTSPGKVILTGYDSSPTPNVPFIIRTNTALTALDTTFNGNGVVLTDTLTNAGGVTTNWYAGMINADGKITVAGYASALTDAYVMRVYGDDFKAQYLPSVAAGTPGIPNPTFPGSATTGYISAGYLSFIGGGQAVSAIPQVVLPARTGGSQYVAFSDGTISRYTNANIVDTSYNTTGHATASQPGVYSMSFLANGGLLLAGTNPNGAINGWIEQYTTAGIPDTTFSGDGIITLDNGTVATVAVQQSLSRIVVAGQLGSSPYNGALFAFTNTGVADATFAVGSSVGTGIYDTGIVGTVYAMVADQFDRLIIAYKNPTSGSVDIRRLTSSGQLDTTFGAGTTGTIAGAIALVDDATQVKIALDLAGNIVVAAHTSTPAIAVKAYPNTTGTPTPITQLNITTIITNTPVLTGLIATADGKILLSGNQSGTNDMWVARVVINAGAYALDTLTTGGNVPFASGHTGIMTFNAGTSGATVRNLTSIAIYGDGEISLVGTETSSGGTANNPFMSRAYDTAYTTQQPLDLDAKAPGTNDLTFGASSTAATNLGVTFYATTDGANQVAKAAVMQNGNSNGVVVAVDGTSTATGAANCIYLSMFDVDGLLNTNFIQLSAPVDIAHGNMLVLSEYDNQYVNDMLTFTVGGVSKAILAGYARNTTPTLTGSLLMQVVLTPSAPALDDTFGGFGGSAVGNGVAFGDGQTLNTVGLQSNGRIIAGGLDQIGNGLLLGYTPAGNLDQSFGQGGTFVQGTTGIYASAIDSQDRLVVAYNVGGTVTLARILADGSGLDTTFNSAGTPGTLTTTITTAMSNSNLRLVIDGSNNIAVVTVLTGGTSFSIARYTSAGALSGTVNTKVSGDFGSLTALTITKLLVDTNGAVVVVGYDNAGSDMILVARFVYSGGTYILDTTFNASAGYIKYEVHGTANQQTVGAFIHPDGRIIITGAQHA